MGQQVSVSKVLKAVLKHDGYLVTHYCSLLSALG